MNKKCKNLSVEDITDRGQIFDHPSYKYRCLLTNKEVVSCIVCKKDRCKNYVSKCEECKSKRC